MALVDDIKSNVDALSSEEKTQKSPVHEAISTAIADYIDANLLLNGVYTGIIPPSTPSGLNGPHTFPVQTNFVHSSISDAVTGSTPTTAMQSYSAALKVEIEKTLATGQSTDGTLTLGASVSFTITLSLSIFGADRDTAYGQLADAIIAALSAGVIVPSSVPATGTDGSSGTVVFSTISIS